MRNSDQSISSQRLGLKNRSPNSKNVRRGGNGQRNTASNSNRNGQGSGSGRRNVSSREKSRNEISQAWASDTTTLSSHMPTIQRNQWDPKAKKNENKNGS
ncbi:MAG: hypothetical protein V3T45_04270, partial [Nitrospinaceae bacterium]